MPELTVSMPAFNTGNYINEAIQSVLNQENIDLELYVVDDSSQDNTSEIVRAINDDRLTLIQNKKNMGIGYCHNLVIEKSNSPFVSHVDSDDIIRPGALRKMVDALINSPDAGQSHSYFFFINEEGTTSRKSFRSIRQHLINHRKPDMDYKWNFLVHGSVMNHLRTYRKEIFDQIGRFNETINYGIDYEMALRIIDKYHIKLVPEFLYCVRDHKTRTTSQIRFQNIKFWYQRYSISRYLYKERKINFPKEHRYDLHRTSLLGFYYIVKKLIYTEYIKSTTSNLVDLLKQNLDLKNVPYRLMTGYFTWWPLDIIKNRSGDYNHKIAYYLWRFPVLSQTFIRRELKALIKSEINVDIIADEKGDFELDGSDSSFSDNIHYIYPIDKTKLDSYKNYFFKQNPLIYINLFIYIICHEYGSYKSYSEDKSLFEKAIYLAGILKDRKINHIHTPWSDRMAFIALICSRLLGIKYTVQARAHDIHRVTHKFGLKEKFNNADAVITNTKYNEKHIQSFINNGQRAKIHTIHEGINLKQFKPGNRFGTINSPVKILSVARLIEEKGLIYLLKACRILKDKGISFKCEIVGGSEEPLYRSYLIYLKKLHRQLELEDDVFFLGNMPLKNVIKKYKESDIFVLPCVLAENGGRDTSPNSLLEAMAMKMPVITTSISGLPEIVDNEINGIVIPPNDENALSQALENLINNAELRKELGENARIKIKERFDINININRYYELFRFDH